MPKILKEWLNSLELEEAKTLFDYLDGDQEALTEMIKIVQEVILALEE